MMQLQEHLNGICYIRRQLGEMISNGGASPAVPAPPDAIAIRPRTLSVLRRCCEAANGI